jgi:hypothetical protein
METAQIEQGYGQIAHTLEEPTEDGKQKKNCANSEKSFYEILASLAG